MMSGCEDEQMMYVVEQWIGRSVDGLRLRRGHGAECMGQST